ncbi:hypothetical protein [Glycomyces tritici]|uniref:Uncharacterized protein n=1 Tax=Glycomyces tritici TaxID=2665176 RepID=A0ABT7YK13_9ACTN|nr:hypothetical protein [Glycomyces tritici]MDN3238977.1 hypothetical protein [Glycomyces tritici]
MVELILAGVIIGAVSAAALVTGIRDHHRRKAARLATERGGDPSGEPIPGGWAAADEGRQALRGGGR